MPPRCQNRKIRSGSVTLLRLSIFSMRNIQKIHAPIGKIFPEKHCHFSGFRIYWEVYRSFLPAPQAGEFSSCTAASGGKQAGKAKLPSPPVFLLFFYSAGIRIFSVAIAPYFRSPGAAIISAPASFRCRSYAGIFSFPESIAVRCLEVFSLPVFRFWISERAAFIPCFYPFGFLRCRFFGLHPPVLPSYCPIF